MSRPLLFSLITLMLFTMNTVKATVADMSDELIVHVKAGNAKEIAKYLAGTVELTILSDENVYSKVQAEAILKDFFAKHQPSSVKLLHKITSNPNYRYTVLVLNTTNGAYRVSFTIKNTGGTFLVSEIRIEPNKD